MIRYKRMETILLTIALLAVSGGILTYNLLTAESDAISVSLSDLADPARDPTQGAISSFAAGVILAADSGNAIPVITGGDAVLTEVLPPIVHPGS